MLSFVKANNLSKIITIKIYRLFLREMLFCNHFSSLFGKNIFKNVNSFRNNERCFRQRHVYIGMKQYYCIGRYQNTTNPIAHYITRSSSYIPTNDIKLYFDEYYYTYLYNIICYTASIMAI